MEAQKDKLLISFSGGETSGYMLYWILSNWSDKYDIKIVFANTGYENEETLVFVQKCSEYFNCEVVWVEAVVWHGYTWNGKKYCTNINDLNRLKYILKKRYKISEKVFNKKVIWNDSGTTHMVVDFLTASRLGEPFESVIQKYGIPNASTPHCNRELKLAPIKSYLRSIGWNKYYSAIGIRSDEIDRMNKDRVKKMILYPLISNQSMTKPKINFWWSQQPFRLKLKGYQGNCKACWKKSDAKLYTILKENPEHFDFIERMENKYSHYIPQTRINKMKKEGKEIPKSTAFFRKNRDSSILKIQADNFYGQIRDDASILEYQIDLDYEQSCDINSECGIDN